MIFFVQNAMTRWPKVKVGRELQTGCNRITWGWKGIPPRWAPIFFSRSFRSGLESGLCKHCRTAEQSFPGMPKILNEYTAVNYLKNVWEHAEEFLGEEGWIFQFEGLLIIDFESITGRSLSKGCLYILRNLIYFFFFKFTSNVLCEKNGLIKISYHQEQL